MQHSILSGSQHGEPTLKLYRTLARTSSLDAIVYCVAHHAQTGRLSWYISARSCFQWVQLDDGSHASSSAISGIARRHQEEIHGSHCRKKSRHEGCRENFGGDAATHKDILSLATGIKDFDDEGLSNHMMNFLAAGHETSSLAATWPCYLLCTHPKVQENLREEVRAHLPSPAAGSDAAPVTFESLENMQYLKAVSRAALRVIPIAPFMRRQASKDTNIIGYDIPAGTQVVNTPWTVNKLQSTWGPDAEEFRPELC